MILVCMGALEFSQLLPFSGSIKALLPNTSVCDGAEFLRSICQCQTLSAVSVCVCVCVEGMGWGAWGVASDTRLAAT